MVVDAEHVLDAVRPHIDSGAVPGAVVGVLSAGAVSLAAAGATEPGGSVPLDPDVVVRISSNTKPIVGALASSARAIIERLAAGRGAGGVGSHRLRC